MSKLNEKTMSALEKVIDCIEGQVGCVDAEQVDKLADVALKLFTLFQHV